MIQQIQCYVHLRHSYYRATRRTVFRTVFHNFLMASVSTDQSDSSNVRGRVASEDVKLVSSASSPRQLTVFLKSMSKRCQKVAKTLYTQRYSEQRCNVSQYFHIIPLIFEMSRDHYVTCEYLPTNNLLFR